jgi:hypothetical protein
MCQILHIADCYPKNACKLNITSKEGRKFREHKEEWKVILTIDNDTQIQIIWLFKGSTNYG